MTGGNDHADVVRAVPRDRSDLIDRVVGEGAYQCVVFIVNTHGHIGITIQRIGDRELLCQDVVSTSIGYKVKGVEDVTRERETQ